MPMHMNKPITYCSVLVIALIIILAWLCYKKTRRTEKFAEKRNTILENINEVLKNIRNRRNDIDETVTDDDMSVLNSA